MRNETLWEIAVQKALDSHLSGQPADMSATDILEKIASYGDGIVDDPDAYDGDDGILVWSKFEYESGEALADMIDTEAQSLMSTFTLVAREIKDHLVELACDDKLPLDMNELDLTMWVKYGINES